MTCYSSLSLAFVHCCCCRLFMNLHTSLIYCFSTILDIGSELDTMGRGQVANSVIGFFHDFDFYYYYWIWRFLTKTLEVFKQTTLSNTVSYLTPARRINIWLKEPFNYRKKQILSKQKCPSLYVHQLKASLRDSWLQLPIKTVDIKFRQAHLGKSGNKKIRSAKQFLKSVSFSD